MYTKNNNLRTKSASNQNFEVKFEKKNFTLNLKKKDYKRKQEKTSVNLKLLILVIANLFNHLLHVTARHIYNI